MPDDITIIYWVVVTTAYIPLIYISSYQKKLTGFKSHLLPTLFTICIILLNIAIFHNTELLYLKIFSILTIQVPMFLFLTWFTKRPLITSISILLNTIIVINFLNIITNILSIYISNEYILLGINTLLLPGALVYTKYFLVRLHNELSDKQHKISLMFSIYSTIVILIQAIIALINRQFNDKIVFLFSFLIYILYFVSFIVFSIIINLYGKELSEISNEYFFEKDLTMINERLELQKENEQKLRILKHDIKHILLSIQTLIKNNQYNDAINLIHEYIGKVDKVKIESFTSNIVIDSIISYYVQYFKNNNIRYEVSIQEFEDELEIPILDFSVFIANCLENATIATMKLNNDRFVKILLVNNKGRLLLHMENTFTGDVIFDARHKPISYRKNHGIGTTSVEWFVNKYNLEIEYKIADNIFAVHVLLNNFIKKNKS